MQLQFKPKSLPNVFKMILGISTRQVDKLTVSFEKKTGLPIVALEISDILFSQIDKYFDQSMKETCSFSDIEEPIDDGKNHFRFRAEGFIDVWEWIEALPKGMIRSVTIFCRPNFPDVTVSVFAKSHVKLHHLRTSLASMEESHVMYETVQPAHRYTGERTDFSSRN